jgi:hypothetical protein
LHGQTLTQSFEFFSDSLDDRVLRPTKRSPADPGAPSFVGTDAKAPGPPDVRNPAQARLSSPPQTIGNQQGEHSWTAGCDRLSGCV